MDLTKRLVVFSALMGAALLLQSCSSNAATSIADDNSASGAIAGVLGGAVSGSSATGTQEHLVPISALVSHASCPTMKTANGSGCTQSGSIFTMTYADCSFGSAAATWTGSQVVTLASGSASCGTFPTTTFTRTFGAGTTRTNKSAVVVTLDTSTNTSNFESDSLGGGTTVTFSSNLRTAININGIRLTSNIFDHTIYTSSPLAFTGDATTTKTLNGTIVLLHNLLKVRATTTVSDVEFTASCCYPTGGSLSTLFDAGTSGGDGSSKYVGKTETLTFGTTCGQATYVGIEGSTATVNLTNCF